MISWNSLRLPTPARTSVKGRSVWAVGSSLRLFHTELGYHHRPVMANAEDGAGITVGGPVRIAVGVVRHRLPGPLPGGCAGIVGQAKGTLVDEVSRSQPGCRDGSVVSVVRRMNDDLRRAPPHRPEETDCGGKRCECASDHWRGLPQCRLRGQGRAPRVLR